MIRTQINQSTAIKLLKYAFFRIRYDRREAEGVSIYKHIRRLASLTGPAGAALALARRRISCRRISSVVDCSTQGAVIKVTGTGSSLSHISKRVIVPRG